MKIMANTELLVVISVDKSSFKFINLNIFYKIIALMHQFLSQAAPVCEQSKCVITQLQTTVVQQYRKYSSRLTLLGECLSFIRNQTHTQRPCNITAKIHKIRYTLGHECKQNTIIQYGRNKPTADSLACFLIQFFDTVGRESGWKLACNKYCCSDL